MKSIVLGIGNKANGDDGVGIFVIEKLAHAVESTKEMINKDQLLVVDCGIVPENYTSIIRKHHPDRVILVDAADMQLVPGSYRIIPPEKVNIMNFSTHSIPLSVLISFIHQATDEVILIGIQPISMEPDSPISASVIKAGERVAQFILNDELIKIRPLEEERPIS